MSSNSGDKPEGCHARFRRGIASSYQEGDDHEQALCEMAGDDALAAGAQADPGGRPGSGTAHSGLLHRGRAQLVQPASRDFPRQAEVTLSYSTVTLLARLRG